MLNKTCLKCGKIFYKKIYCSKKEWETSKFCSHSCANSVSANGNKYRLGQTAWNKDKTFPERSGVNNPRNTSIDKVCLECGKGFIVKNYRKDCAIFCSVKCKNEHQDNGKTDTNYRIRRSTEFKKWRELVYERDDWTCQKCLGRGNKLNPHHIENFSDNEEKRFDIDNGITLCECCHYEFHSKYGFMKNNKEQIVEFLAVTTQA